MTVAWVGRTASLWWPGNLTGSSAALALLALAIAGAIVALPLTLSVAMVTGCILAIVILLRPVVGLAALAIAVPLGSLADMSVGGLQISAAEPIAAITTFSWLVHVASRRGPRFRFPRPTWAIAAFLCLMLYDLTLVGVDSTSLKEVLRWSELLAVAIVAGNVLRSKAHVYGILAAVFAAGIVESLIGWYQFFMRVGPAAFAQGRFLRAYGTFSQPNPFAGYLAMVWPLAASIVLYWFVSAVSSRSGRAKAPAIESPSPALSQNVARATTIADTASATTPTSTNQAHTCVVPPLLALMSLAAFLVIGAALLMSFSRGAWMGIAIAIVLVTGLFKRRLFAFLPLIAGLVVAIVAFGQFDLLPQAVAGRIGDVAGYFRIFDARSVQTTSENWAIVERMASWQAAWGMFEASPLFGVGPGHFVAAYERYGLPNWPPLGHAHNYYLNVLAEMGATGLAAYVLTVSGWFVGGLSYLRSLSFRDLALSRGAPRLNLERAVIIGVLGALAAAAVHNVFDNLYVHEMNLHVGLLIGLMMAIGQRHYYESATGNARQERVSHKEVNRY